MSGRAKGANRAAQIPDFAPTKAQDAFYSGAKCGNKIGSSQAGGRGVTAG